MARASRIWWEKDRADEGSRRYRQDVCTASDSARLWDVVSLKHVGEEEYSGIRATSPDGTRALSGGCEDNTAFWTIAATREMLGVLKHHARVGAVAISPDGRILLTGSDDKTARLWDADTLKPIGPALQHEHGVRAVSFSPDGKYVLTGSLDTTARLWRVPEPVKGDPERIVLWTEVISGTEFTPGDFLVRVLRAKTWRVRRRRLDAGASVEAEK